MWLHYRVSYSRSFKEYCDLIFKGRSGRQECREGSFLFEHSSWTVRPLEDENTMVSRNVGNQIPTDAASYPRTMATTRGNAENHTINMPRCATRLFRLFCCLQSEFLSFRRFASSRFNFLSPDRFPVLGSIILRVQFCVTKFLRIFGSDPYLTSVIQSDCRWLIANKNCRLVINTATVRNVVYGIILCIHVIIRK